MGRRGIVVLVASAVALLVPAGAQATTVTLGDANAFSSLSTGTGCFMCTTELTYAESYTPPAAGAVDVAPAAGVITSWRVEGQGTLALRVIEGGPEGGWLGRGRSGAATSLEGQPNPTSLAIGAGDLIGLSLPPDHGKNVIRYEELENGEQLEWSGTFADNGEERAAAEVREHERLELSAEVVLTPVISSLSPASGSTAGGNAVTIAGKYLDGATSVTFGSVAASSFSVDSAAQITAIAPPSVASVVDVRVSGPGGASAVGTADHYASVAPAAPAATTTTTTTSTTSGQAATPTISGFSQTASSWRRGRSFPRISSTGGTPVGTTFSFALNEPATTIFSFSQRVAGRRVNGRCVPVSRGNAGRQKCKRAASAGSFSLAGHAGNDKVKFQGRLSGARTLKPGAYRLTIAARDSRGMLSASQSLSFTIVS